MAGTDKRKQSLYFPEEMLKEIQEEANRQDRSLSWVVQQAWKIARERIKAFPAVNDVSGEDAVADRREQRIDASRSERVFDRQSQTESLFPRRHAGRNPARGVQAGPVDLVDRSTGVEGGEDGHPQDAVGQ
jgi:uncharacterized small protein (TIGR04563 family)